MNICEILSSFSLALPSAVGIYSLAQLRHNMRAANVIYLNNLFFKKGRHPCLRDWFLLKARIERVLRG